MATNKNTTSTSKKASSSKATQTKKANQKAYYYKDKNGNLMFKQSGNPDNNTTNATTKSNKKKKNKMTPVAYTDTSIPNYIDLLNDTEELNGKVTIKLDTVDDDTQNTLLSKMMSTNISGIEALPYQFMASVDTRLDGTGINSTKESMVGRKYAEKIMGRLPLLFLTPGKPQALADFSKQDKQSVINMLLDSNFDEDLINGEGRYYNLTYAYDEYFRYLNCMLSATAAFLGIYDEQIPINGKMVKLGTYDWSNELNDDFKTFFSAKENLVFYLDNLFIKSSI